MSLTDAITCRRTPDGQVLSSYNQNTTNRRYYLTDHLGSVVAVTSSNVGNTTAVYSYDPYGNTRTATGTDAATNPLRYTGGYLDTTTGLHKLGARYYDTATGRFTQQDPSGQEDNPYLYATGNPRNYVDRNGLDAAGCFQGFLTLPAAFSRGVALLHLLSRQSSPVRRRLGPTLLPEQPRPVSAQVWSGSRASAETVSFKSENHGFNSLGYCNFHHDRRVVDDRNPAHPLAQRSFAGGILLIAIPLATVGAVVILHVRLKRRSMVPE